MAESARLLARCALLCWLAALAWPPAQAEPRASSEIGAVAIPQPARPAGADSCVEPVEVMRREHMNLLLHQRDQAVIEGRRDGRYGLVDCLECHNPGDTAEVVRYDDPGHFCGDCHVYAGVRIDCFECHADRGLQKLQQGRLSSRDHSPWADHGQLSAGSYRREAQHVD